MPRLQDYGFKLKVVAIKKYLLIKYPAHMVVKILRELDLGDNDQIGYRVFIDKFRNNLAN
jgi:hypothetical protein